MKFAVAALIGLAGAAQLNKDYDPVPKYYTPFDHEERTKVVEHADGLNTGGEPSGKFWMNQASALAASKEVLATHKGLSGKMLDDYVNTYFAKAWGHFDVNQTGFIE